MLYSIAKQRKGSDVDLTTVHAHPGDIAHRSLALSKQPNAKKKKKIKYKTVFLVISCTKQTRGEKITEMSTRGKILRVSLQQSAVAL